MSMRRQRRERRVGESLGVGAAPAAHQHDGHLPVLPARPGTFISDRVSLGDSEQTLDRFRADCGRTIVVQP